MMLGALLLATLVQVQDTVVAFVDYTVLPMAGVQARLPHHTVIVRHGIIAEVGPSARVRVPAGARTVHGGGTQYLMPGLADMHVHSFARDELALFLGNGITTVRNLHGLRMHLAWRDSIARGLLHGPRIFTAGPIIDGAPPSRPTNRVITTPAQADSIVRAQKAAGFDQVKVYDNVSMPVYRALAEAARRERMPLVGHLPTPVGLDSLIAVGYQHSIEHVGDELRPFVRDLSDSVSIDLLARRIAAAGIWVDATFSVWQSVHEQASDWARASGAPEIAYVDNDVRGMFSWSQGNGARDNAQQAAMSARVLEFMRTFVRLFHRAGGKLVIGTDSPMPFVVPGFALAGELHAHVQAGLSAHDVLRMATSGAAAFMGVGSEQGTIETGRRGDIITLAADPLLDVRNVRTLTGLMTAGRYHDGAALRRELEAVRLRNAAPRR